MPVRSRRSRPTASAVRKNAPDVVDAADVVENRRRPATGPRLCVRLRLSSSRRTAACCSASVRSRRSLNRLLRLDVQPDVIEEPGRIVAAGRLDQPGHERELARCLPSIRARNGRSTTLVTNIMEVLGIVEGCRGVLEVRFRLTKPGGSEAVAPWSPRRRIPRAPPTARRSLPLRLMSEGLGAMVQAVQVAGAAALRHEPSARAKTGNRLAKRRE